MPRSRAAPSKAKAPHSGSRICKSRHDQQMPSPPPSPNPKSPNQGDCPRILHNRATQLPHRPQTTPIKPHKIHAPKRRHGNCWCQVTIASTIITRSSLHCTDREPRNGSPTMVTTRSPPPLPAGSTYTLSHTATHDGSKNRSVVGTRSPHHQNSSQPHQHALNPQIPIRYYPSGKPSGCPAALSDEEKPPPKQNLTRPREHALTHSLTDTEPSFRG